MFSKFKGIILLSSLAILANISLPAISVLQKANTNQEPNLTISQDPLVLSDPLTVFGANGINFINPNPGSDFNTGINLRRNSAGDLIWNDNIFLTSTGELTAANGNFTGDLRTNGGFTGNLTGTASRALIADALANNAVVPLNQFTGVLAVANGGSGSTTSTGTGSVVLNSSPTLTNPNIEGVALGNVPVCDQSHAGELYNNPARCRLELCDGTRAISPNGRPFNKKRIFVSSQIYPGNLGLLSGAHAKCQALANAQNLKGTWKALMSDSVTDARSFTDPNVTYIRMDGEIINLCNLWDGNIDAPILITEDLRDIRTIDYGNQPLGASVNGVTGVWTGSNSAGRRFSSGIFVQPNTIVNLNCQDWTTSASQFNDDRGISALADNIASSWIAHGSIFGGCLPFQQGCVPDADLASPKICSIPQHIYCVEQ